MYMNDKFLFYIMKKNEETVEAKAKGSKRLICGSCREQWECDGAWKRGLTVTYFLDGRHKEFITDYGQRHEEVEGDDDVDDDGASLPLLLREQVLREVVYSRGCAIKSCKSGLSFNYERVIRLLAEGEFTVLSTGKSVNGVFFLFV